METEKTVGEVYGGGTYKPWDDFSKGLVVVGLIALGFIILGCVL